MFASTFTPTLRRALMAAALSACAGLASAQTLHVVLDTATLGSAGYLDLEFNPANLPAASTSAMVSNLSGFGDLSGVSLMGDVQQKSGGFLFGNSTSFNDLFQSMNFGGKVSFDVTFSGLPDASSAAIPSKFAVSFYGTDQVTPLGQANPLDGSAMSLSWQPGATQGAVSLEVSDHTVAAITAVPEPSSWLMLGAGLALVGWTGRRKLQA